jgi:S-adenosylmethionine synthetase
MSDSSVNASIVVGSDAVKLVVEKNMDQLKLALNQQGIMVSQMNVSVGRQGNQPFGNGGLNGQNTNGGAGSVGGGSVAPVDLSAVDQSGAYGKTGSVLVNLTA